MSEIETTTEMSDQSTDKSEGITFADFLENTPPSQELMVTDLTKNNQNGVLDLVFQLQTPELQLYCANDLCNGYRFFRFCEGSRTAYVNRDNNIYFTYECSNCKKSHKIFSFKVVLNGDDPRSGICYKYGEFPNYGPPTPPRLLRLFGDDREIFLKGRRCENKGLGIGAFVYYRRVVENQKNRILDGIIKVSQKLDAAKDLIDALEGAKKEIQFSKALASVKDAIPQALLINGQNPLTLLHSALSRGVHDMTDEVCLEVAHDVRVVLAELSERLGQALKDEAELNSAVSRLINAKQNK